MVLERGKIQPSERGWQTIARQAVDSLEKGLIELLTNADESYTRLEKRGKQFRGKLRLLLIGTPGLSPQSSKSLITQKAWTAKK